MTIEPTFQPSSSNTNTKTITIRVVGDVNINAITLPLPSTEDIPKNADNNFSSETSFKYFRFNSIGGTPLLEKSILSVIEKEKSDFNSKIITYKPELLEKKYNSWSKLLINFSLYPSKADALNNLVYRINKDIGWIRDKESKDEDSKSCQETSPYQDLVDQIIKDQIINDQQENNKQQENNFVINVINDRNLGFRKLSEKTLASLFPERKNTYFVIALGYPLNGSVYDNLSINDCCESTLVLHATSLRSEGINIQEAASIEQTVQHFLYHLDKNSLLKKLCKCRHLVIYFDDGGALHYDSALSGGPTYHYCPFFNTNETYIPFKYGSMIGYRTIMVTAITKGIAWALQNGKQVTDGIHNGIRLGVLLGKYHFREGFNFGKELERRRDSSSDDYQFSDSDGSQITDTALKKLFGTFAIKTEMTKNLDNSLWSTVTKDFAICREYSVASLKLPRTQHEMKDWSRIYSFLDYHQNDQSQFEKEVLKIVQFGLDRVVFEKPPEEYRHKMHTAWFPKPRVLCPYVEFGKIRTSDRSEIDSLFWLSAILRKYLENHNWRKPLSIATFGPPGSGKSFTVKQILKSISPSATDTTLEFNVAQFTSVDNLTTAFHQAQDKALSEKVPLIIFDEFDATFNNEPLGWLKYFLAPMQDGVFNGEHGTYQVGKAIFVFAGGTSHTFENFCQEPANSASFRNAKGPDFISRLRGYLNIGDINAIENGAKEVNNLLMYRRAIILRSILEEKTTEIFDPNTGKVRIDPKVVRAFLKVPKYKHGVRSMEAIIEMAILACEGFVPASLPPRNQLQMHVDADEFLRLMIQR